MDTNSCSAEAEVDVSPEPSTAGGFELRAVNIILLRAVSRYALTINPDPAYWTMARVSALLIGNHEILKDGNRWSAEVSDPSTKSTAHQIQSTISSASLGSNLLSSFILAPLLLVFSAVSLSTLQRGLDWFTRIAKTPQRYFISIPDSYFQKLLSFML